MQINNNLLINPIKSNFNDKVTTLPYGNVNKNQQDSYTPFIPRKQSGIKQAILDARNNALIKISPQSFINSYLNKRFLNKELQNNPNIKNVLRSKGIIPKLEIENVKNIINSHLIPTMKYATGIMQASGEDFSKKDYEIMAYASLLHDTGKTLIPSSAFLMMPASLRAAASTTAPSSNLFKSETLISAYLRANTLLKPRLGSLL